MVHIQTIMETHPDNWKKVYEFIKSRQYKGVDKNGDVVTSYATMREVKIIEFCIREECVDDILKDLTIFQRPYEESQGFGKFIKKMVWFIKRMYPNLRSVDSKKYYDKERELQILSDIKNRNVWFKTFVIGCLDDSKNKNGEEMI